VGGHDSEDERVLHTLEATLGMPFSRGNRIRVLRNGNQIFPAMLEAIEAATLSVEFLTFIYWKGEIAHRFAHALAARARAGVQVRVILDAIGSMPMDPALIETMRAAGVDVLRFRPPLRWRLWEIDNRTHRKVLICDGKLAFTGGVGIATEWEGDARNVREWRDTHFQIEGPAVHGIQAAFIDNWVEAGRRVNEQLTRVQVLEPVGESLVQVMRTSAAVNWSSIATMVHVLLSMAERDVRIATAYFVPDESVLCRLSETARRGVDVRILIPGPHHDQRLAQLAQEHEYAPLMQAGVRMFAFQPSMMHAKIITVDGIVAAVGSANFNQRSMSKDDELALLLLDRGIVEQLDSHFEEDCARSLELHPSHMHARGFARKLGGRITSLFRHQL
jgi:cardiolipin synthase A/B